MEIDEKLTVYNILKNSGSYRTLLQRGMESARLNDAFYTPMKVLPKISNLSAPKLAIENDNESDDLQGEGMKNIIPSNITGNSLY